MTFEASSTTSSKQSAKVDGLWNIGSGGGRDAAYLEKHGLHVRRTDVTPAFVDLLRHEGHTADLLDPLHDNLSYPRPTRRGL